MSSPENSLAKSSLDEVIAKTFVDGSYFKGTTRVAALKSQLAWRGWTVITDVPNSEDVKEILKSLGSLLPQYTGEITYDVKALPGFEAFQYSQSANTIQPHTEAPVYTPPPKYLALHCQRQARCGNGHTLIADGFEFLQSLPDDLRAEALTRQHSFSGNRTPEVGADAAPSVHSPVLSIGPTGEAILRFSYNVFRYNNLHPSLDQSSHASFEGSDAFYRRMCEAVEKFFGSRNTPVLIPDGGLLIFDNHRMLHARSRYQDMARHLIRYWIGDASAKFAAGVEE